MVPKVSEAHREQRRAKLLDAAIACFSDKGYEATSIDDIVQFAGVSKGMMYTYFRSKDEVFLELVRHQTDVFLRRLDEELEACKTTWDRLQYVLCQSRKTSLSEERRRWTTVYLEFFLSTARSETKTRLMQNRYRQFIQIIGRIVKEGQATGEFRATVNPTTLAAAYWAMCDGIDLHVSQLGDTVDIEGLYQTAIDLLRDSVVVTR